MTEKMSQNELLALTTEIVASHVSNNTVAVSDLPELIRQVYGSLTNLSPTPAAEQPEKPQPAVAIKKSVTPEYIVCLEDGKKLKMLKRHLKTRYDMTPEEYRKRWALPDDYPMVAPSYAQQRSALAKKIGLRFAAAPAEVQHQTRRCLTVGSGHDSPRLSLSCARSCATRRLACAIAPACALLPAPGRGDPNGSHAWVV